MPPRDMKKYKLHCTAGNLKNLTCVMVGVNAKLIRHISVLMGYEMVPFIKRPEIEYVSAGNIFCTVRAVSVSYGNVALIDK
jgi:hypothetical protein